MDHLVAVRFVHRKLQRTLVHRAGEDVYDIFAHDVIVAKSHGASRGLGTAFMIDAGAEWETSLWGTIAITPIVSTPVEPAVEVL